MPQAIAPPLGGIQLATNTTGGQVRILTGTGDPNLAATDNANGDLAASGIASVYLRQDGSGGLYQKTAVATQAAPTGTWTAK